MANCEQTLRATDEEMSTSTSTSQQSHNEQTLQPIGHPRTSKYTTGLLTTSGWIIQDNASWHVLRSSGAPHPSTAANNADVQELLICQNEKRDNDLGTATISYKNDVGREHYQCVGTDAIPSPEDCFDYNPDFRHSEWNDRASLQQDSVASILSTVPPVSNRDDVSGLPATAEAEAEVESTVTIKASMKQHVSATIVGKGQSMKKVKAWYHPDEIAWLLLLHQRVKAAVEAGRKIRLPGPAALTLAFNVFFEGRVLQDEHGVDLSPREARDEQSIKGKIMKTHTEIWKVRDLTRKLLEGKRYDEVYMPGIKLEELRRFQVHGTV